MKTSRLLCLAGIGMVLSSTGCSSLYSDAISEFHKGMTSAKGIILDRANAMDEVKRRKLIEKAFYGDTKIDPDLEANKENIRKFSDSVCSASAFLNEQRSALATLEIYDTTLQQTNTKPKEEIGAIAQSIWDNWKEGEALKPKEWVPTSATKCALEVGHLLTMEYSEVPEFAPLAIPALVTAADGLVAAFKKLAVVSLGMVDDWKRGSKIKAYVLASAPTVKEKLDALNAIDPGFMKYCSKINYDPPCRTEAEKEVPPTKLDSATVSQKWAALRKPWHLFLSMSSTKNAYDKSVSDHRVTDRKSVV